MRRVWRQLTFAVGVALMLPAFASANPVTDENALPGTSGWERSEADSPNIQGYTDKTSVAPGGTIGFRVSTSPAVTYRIIVYRLGWYGGSGARQVACLPACTGTGTGSVFSGAARSTPSPNAQTGEIDASNNGSASWPQSASWTVPANAASGEYVAEYIPASGSQSGRARYSPFVVRPSAPQASASGILVVVPFNTYNAYNLWGGTSAYDNTTSQSGPFPPNSNDHATKVSFNRPFYRREWRFWDLPLLRFLEREGYDVSYVSDTDVDANPGILQQHRAVIVSGHSEYWTKAMRNGFDAARNAGTNLMFAGANDAYWQVRYEDSTCPDDNTVCSTVGDQRTMVIYKGPDEGPNDPMPGTADDTSRFRDLGRPECELMGGVQYGSYFTNDGYRDYTTTGAGAADPWAAGTGLTSGSTLKGLVGFEYDSYDPTCQPPGQPTILFQYAGPETSAAIDAAAVRYTDPASGARVFSSGTEQWAWGLDSYRWDPTMFTGIPATQPTVQQFTRNMLADMVRPSPPSSVTATRSGDTVSINTTPRSDARVSSYKVYRHDGTGSFQPGDAGVTLVCQNASGDCTDTPPGGTFRYAVTAIDQWGESSAVLSSAVTISPVTAVDDSATVNEDAAATPIDVLANDTPSGTTKTITSRTQAAKGNVVITGGGTGLTYQPNANYCGPDTFTYTINGSSTATVSIGVSCVDDPPVALNDSASLAEDAGATAVDVLANDTDVDGGPKTVSSAAQPSHGTVVRNGDSSGLTYQPNANYCGADSFTYTLNGGDSASVSVTVSCVDDPPVAFNDTATVNEDAPATSIPVLSNDTDSDGGPKTIASRTLPPNGNVVITGGGSGLTYQPDSNYCGPDSFTYALNGGDTATVSVTVTCVDDSPVASHDTAAVSGNSGATSIGVLANDTDIDGGPKTIASASPPAHGAVVVASGGTGLTYQPAPGYCGADGFTYTLNGGSSATVSVTVDCSSPPTAADDQATLPQAAGPTAIDVLANDPDPDGGPKTIASATQPGGGIVAIVAAGSGLTYQPNPGYCNSLPGMPLDSFTYTLNGGSIGNVVVTVTCPAAGVDAGSAIGPQPSAKKCKKGFRKVKGKCKKKRKRRK